MLIKIDNTKKMNNGPISMLVPALALKGEEPGLTTIYRIHQSVLPAGTKFSMHQHMDEDILTYLRSGKSKHTDSAGNSEILSPTKFMLMKAGSGFLHQEEKLETGAVLQILLRSAKKNAKPEVLFSDFKNAYSINQWRLIASPDPETKLRLSTDTWIYDIRITDLRYSFSLPEDPKLKFTYLLYVFEGSVTVNKEIILTTGESLYIKNEKINFEAHQLTDIVLFEVNTDGPYIIS